MRLVITDTGFIWNQNNPFLDKYKDIVLVVCLCGKAVTDKYECFVSPFTEDDIVMGIDTYGIEDRKFQKLASVGRELNVALGYHDDIVFLTDNQPSSLYPFYVIQELNQYNSLHLVTMLPLKFEASSRRKGHRELLSDLSKLDSILYYDMNKLLEILDGKTTLPQAYDYLKKLFGNIMPCFLNGIDTMDSKPCSFDFSAMKYIPLEGGFDKLKLFIKDAIEDDIKLSTSGASRTMGFLVRLPSYPDASNRVKEGVEKFSVSLDGKKVCNILREQRIKLAEANQIPFKSEECLSVGPCAGTCEKCDEESQYLRKKMQNIPEEKRVYPQFDPREEMEL
ncbi:MAG: hypothetical protein K1W16_15390 [Lachnospiraceae bacterium]